MKNNMNRAVIDRIEEEVVVCALDDGGEVLTPLYVVPDDVGEGDVVYISISRENDETVSTKIEAKELLQELLKTEEPT